MGVVDQAELFEQLERAVDGSDVDAGGALAHVVVHRFGRRMAQLVHRLQDQLALRGEPQTALPEHRGEGRGGHLTSIVLLAQPPTRRSRADRCGSIPWPWAAM